LIDRALKGRRAFTLIELLVVISIIALLIAILLPALSQARETAVQAQCLSQIRSMAQATHMYQADEAQYYDYGLECANPNDGGFGRSYHSRTLNRYLGIAETLNASWTWDGWKCPDIWPEAQQARPGVDAWCNYAGNANLMGWIYTTGNYYSASYGPFGDTSNQNVKEADIKDPPQQTAMWVDGHLPRGWIIGTSNGIRATAVSHYFTPHFSSDQYTYGGALGLPSWPDLLAGGGKTATSFMDGHGGAYEAADFPGGSGNASWQLDVN
jgi:prepilin-type N-terminal cleavage/methylation domain-containing protein